jgi:hypothetical protein
MLGEDGRIEFIKRESIQFVVGDCSPAEEEEEANMTALSGV